MAEESLARLTDGLADGEGVLVLSGPPGTGKTLLVYRLLEALGRDRASILLPASRFANRAALLQACLFDLDLPYEGKSEQELRLALTAHLLEQLRQKGNVVLVADEAQHLGADLLEELRLLGNLEAGGRRAIQVVLVGLDDLAEMLPMLPALDQRITTRVRLEPLDPVEAIDYCTHLLRAAGPGAADVVGEEVREAVALAAGGVPRRMNQILREAIKIAQSCEADVVDVEMVQEALVRLGLVCDEDGSLAA